MKNIFAFTFLFFAFASNHLFAQFTLPKLPYDYNALEPFIDAETMQIHHDKHHQGYVNNLNSALTPEMKGMSLEQIFSKMSSYNSTIRNNAGGHYNHTMFWTMLTPNLKTQVSTKLLKAINKEFTSLDSMKALIQKAGSTQFGSGWAWLIVTKDHKLKVCNTPNQDNTLMNDVKEQGIPIIAIDVWEHAYYLKYQNKRGDYLAKIWNVINWDEISRRYDEAMSIRN